MNVGGRGRCVQSAGQPFPDFVLSNCMQWVASARKGLWQSMLYSGAQTQSSLCQWYVGYIHDVSQHVFDQWADDSQQAATALSSFLEDLIVPQAQTLGTCTAIETNPNVFTMLPVPSDHFQICGLTSSCQLRCADTLTFFYLQLNASKSSMPPFAYAVSAESPFFNPYQSTSSSLSYVAQQIVALSSRNLTSSLACQTCPPQGGCLLLVQTPWSQDGAFTATTYCVPPANALKASVYASGLEDWTFSLSGPSGTLTFVDLALQTNELYVLVGYSTASITISKAGAFAASASASSSATASTQQTLYAVRYDESDTFHKPQQALTYLLLDTNQIAAMLMTKSIQDSVFSMPVANVQVTQCSITTLLELASGVRGKLLFFLSLTFSAQGYTTQTNNELIMTAGAVNAIFLWYDPTFSSAAPQMQFFLPCTCVSGSPPCACTADQPCQPVLGCRPGLDAALYLGQMGTFLHVSGNTYLHIPATTNVQELALQYVSIDPTGDRTLYPVPPPNAGLNYEGRGGAGQMLLYKPLGPSPGQGQRAQIPALSAWTRADVFALSGLATRLVRSPVIEDSLHIPVRWLQSTQTSAAVVQWFAEMLLLLTDVGFQLQVSPSVFAKPLSPRP